MKKIIFLICLCFGFQLSAQEVDLPEYINHMADNPFIISPSYAGIGSGLQIRLNGVSQWVGVENSPNTQSLSVEARIAERFGGGLIIFNDSNGFTSQQGLRFSLASHLTLSDVYDSFLSFGLSYSFIQFSQDTSRNNLEELGTPDPLAVSRAIGSSNFDISMLYRFDRFAISANVINLLDKDIEDFTTGEPEVLRRYSLYTLYNWRINRDVEIEPSIFVKYFEASKRSKTDANIKLRRRINDGYIWAGVSVTLLNDQLGIPNDFSPMLGIKKHNFYFSYGLGLDTNDIISYNYGTHMITLGFDYDRRPSLARCTQKLIMMF